MPDPTKGRYHKPFAFIPKHVNTAGLVPTLEQLPCNEEVAVNRKDDVIYRNVNGVIIKYVRAKDGDQT